MPSLILAAILILVGVQLWIFGFIADIIAVNRKLLEDIQLRVRRIELGESASNSTVMLSEAKHLSPFLEQREIARDSSLRSE